MSESKPAAVAMRSTWDRVRHTFFFELGLIAALIPVGMFLFDASAKTMGGTALALSLIAMAWNAVYNYVFDHYMAKHYQTTEKTSKQRLVHALLFEAGLLITTIPIMAWALDLTLFDAFIADIGFVVFALVYAYVYNLAYDKIFPICASPTLAVSN